MYKRERVEQVDCTWRVQSAKVQLRAAMKLKLKTSMHVRFACDPGKLVYAQALNKLYHKVQADHLSGFERAYGWYAAPCNCMQFLSCLNLRKSAIKMEYKNRTDF